MLDLFWLGTESVDLQDPKGYASFHLHNRFSFTGEICCRGPWIGVRRYGLRPQVASRSTTTYAQGLQTPKTFWRRRTQNVHVSNIAKGCHTCAVVNSPDSIVHDLDKF